MPIGRSIYGDIVNDDEVLIACEVYVKLDLIDAEIYCFLQR